MNEYYFAINNMDIIFKTFDIMNILKSKPTGWNWFGSAAAEPNQFHPDPAHKLSANLYDIYHCCVQRKTPDDGQRNCPKQVEFCSKNKFEKLVHLVGFTIRRISILPNGLI